MFISIVIPTFGREQVLLNTIEDLLRLENGADEIIIVDQTQLHEESTNVYLEKNHTECKIRWIRIDFPSITRAMNVGLREAKGDRVLFLDDDIIPDSSLVNAHRNIALEKSNSIIAGRVLQPWHDRKPDMDESEFLFNSLVPRKVESFMGGNVSIPRVAAINIGGFDTNFVKVAYHFEAEFAERWRQSGLDIYYEPKALIHHLKTERGGTRSFGEHLTTINPDHAVGKFYYYFCKKNKVKAVHHSLLSLIKSILTKHHLKHPAWVPVTLIAEFRGVIWAIILHISGRGLIYDERITIEVCNMRSKNDIRRSLCSLNHYKYKVMGNGLSNIRTIPRYKPELVILSGKLDYWMVLKGMFYSFRNIPCLYLIENSSWLIEFLCNRKMNHICLIKVSKEESDIQRISEGILSEINKHFGTEAS